MQLRSLQFLSIIVIALCPAYAQARPVSYPSGWTLITNHDSAQNSLLVHYTLNAKNAVGLRLLHDQQNGFKFMGGQFNHLLKRWNRPNSQANIYARVGLGAVFDDAPITLKRDTDGAIFLGLSADWETRRYFISGEAQYWNTGRFGDYSRFRGRVGMAPYVANTGALHTWFMIEGYQHRAYHDPIDVQDTTGVNALIRLLKGPSLLELGINDNGNALLNYIHRF